MPTRSLFAAPATRGLIAGTLSGLAGALFFAAAHAAIIVPIWDRMGSGLAFGALAGAAAGWAMAELFPRDWPATGVSATWRGAVFGALLWVLVSPVTAADALLRATGLAPRFELLAVAVALLLSIGSGAGFWWWRTRSRRAAVAGAAATLALTIAMAGPVPVGRSVRAWAIFFAVLPAAMISGMLISVARYTLERAVAGPPELPASSELPGSRGDTGSTPVT